jgi:uncharacterized protein YbjT (DUF2867 family)
MPPRILVTGVTGTVGGELVKLLCARGVVPVALVRSPEKVGSVYEGCAEVRVADLRDELEARDAFARIDKLFLVTPLRPDQVEMGERLIAAAEAAGVKHVVKLSVIGAELEPGTLFGRQHRAVEGAIERSGMAHTFLRANEPMQTMAGSWGATIARDDRFCLPTGDAAVSWIDARDVAAVGVEALLDDGFAGRALTLTGPSAVTYSEVAAIISDVTGRRVEYVDVPEETARADLAAAGIPEPILTGILEVWGGQKAGSSAAVTSDFADATGVPPRSFGAFARDYRRAWMPSAAATGTLSAP